MLCKRYTCMYDFLIHRSIPVCGILFFLNYEKNYLTRDNIKENVPAGNLHTRTWKKSIEKIIRQGYDKHMTTSKRSLSSYINMKASDTRERS